MQAIVVTAAIIAREGKVLVAQRPVGKHNGLTWEFPGGKVEEGETPEQALERELREELGVETRTGRIYDARLCVLPDRTLLILYYFSRLVSGEPRALEAASLLWAAREELTGRVFSSADALVAQKLYLETGHASPWEI